MKKKIAIAVLSLLVSFEMALADSAANGTDMWTKAFEQWGLFTPHEDYCDSSSEEFISISGSASRGFCIEKSERTADTWEDARDACASLKKRLPEPGEWKFACAHGTSLSNMTDDYEWASNFLGNAEYGLSGTGYYGYGAIRIGDGNCYTASIGWMATSTSIEESLPFRCVR